MTIGEVDRYIKGYIFREDRNTKYKAKMDYLLARTIVSGIGASFNGKPMPTIYQCYPDFFDEEADRTRQSVANFINFAKDFNRRFNKKKKGELNDPRTTKSNN